MERGPLRQIPKCFVSLAKKLALNPSNDGQPSRDFKRDISALLFSSACEDLPTPYQSYDYADPQG